MNLGVLNGMLVLVVIGLLTPLTSLGLKTASMRLPPELAETALRLPVEGYDGANRGRFELDGYSGSFTRTENRLALGDALYASNRGKSSFTMAGPGIDGSIDAACSFEQSVATVEVVTYDPKKLSYVCEISGGLPGQLTLGEPRPQGMKQRVLARSIRRGLAEFGSLRIEIASVHEYAGSRLQSQTPVGYVFSIDSLVRGALELTDINPTVFVDEGLSGRDRIAVLTAAIAVSLLRDPANSSLDE